MIAGLGVPEIDDQPGSPISLLRTAVVADFHRFHLTIPMVGLLRGRPQGWQTSFGVGFSNDLGSR